MKLGGFVQAHREGASPKAVTKARAASKVAEKATAAVAKHWGNDAYAHGKAGDFHLKAAKAQLAAGNIEKANAHITQANEHLKVATGEKSAGGGGAAGDQPRDSKGQWAAT